MDEDDGRSASKRPRIHYGSLEESERERLTKGSSGKSAIREAVKAGNINISGGKL